MLQRGRLSSLTRAKSCAWLTRWATAWTLLAGVLSAWWFAAWGFDWVYDKLFVRHWDTWADGRTNVLYAAPIDTAGKVSAEPVELARVLSNLLENARRYGQSPSDGVTRVEIVARVHDGWVLLRVRDQGPGVSEETLKNLTQPFYRGDTARTSATGSGLGLAIVERSVQRMEIQRSAAAPLGQHLAVGEDLRVLRIRDDGDDIESRDLGYFVGVVRRFTDEDESEACRGLCR